MRPLIPVLALVPVALVALLAGHPGAQAQPAAGPKDAPPRLVELPGRDAVTRTMERKVLRALARKNVWDGPTQGPRAQPGKFIVFVAADLKNGGVAGVAQGAEQASQAIGWKWRLLDGQGTVKGRTAAMNQALGLKPDGIVLGGFDAQEQAVPLADAARRKVPVVGWHAGQQASGVPGLFYNVTTSAQGVAEIAALYAVTESRGKAGVVIFTDSAYSVATSKAEAMAAIVQACKGCTLLGIEDTPLAETAQRMPALTTALQQRHGERWTHSLGINDLYFDFMPVPRADAGAPRPVANLSAGDGSETAYGRIRQGQGQVATVPEPLNLHGWQVIDELNRALAGQPPSGYSTPVHLVTPSTIVFDGGPRNEFDPDNGYRQHYKTLWGK